MDNPYEDNPYEERRAFFTLGDVDDIASAAFGRRVQIAHELGLLDELIAGDREAVLRRTSGLKSFLFAQIPSELPRDPRHASEYERVR